MDLVVDAGLQLDLASIWSAFFHSLFVNYGAWLVTYSVAYGFVCVWFREELRPWKLNSGDPPPWLVRREIRRGAVSVLVCVILDVCLSRYGRFIDTGAQPAPSHSAPLRLFLWTQWHLVPLLVLWADAHFYWIHRALHESSWLYQHVHKVHHESKQPDPWSGMSFHPVEAALYFSSLCIILVLPMQRLTYDIFRLGLLLSPIGGHVGHGHPSCPIGYDHWVHHHKFMYNFGSGVFPWNGIWDNLCGTAFREGSASTSRRDAAAKKQAGTTGGSTSICSTST